MVLFEIEGREGMLQILLDNKDGQQREVSVVKVYFDLIEFFLLKYTKLLHSLINDFHEPLRAKATVFYVSTTKIEFTHSNGFQRRHFCNSVGSEARESAQFLVSEFRGADGTPQVERLLG